MTRTALLVACLLALLAAAPARPAAELVRVLADGRSTRGWTFHRDQARLDEEYQDNRLAASGGTYDWRFVPRSVAYADIFLLAPLEHPFDRLQVEVRNLGAPLQIVGRLLDEGGAEYISERVPLPAGAGWRPLSFPLSSFRLGWWSHDRNQALDFPVSEVSLTVYEVQPGTAYRLLFRRLAVVNEAGTRVRLASGPLPARWRAGQVLPLRLRLISDDWSLLGGREVALDAYREGRLAHTQRLGALPEPAGGEAVLALPRFVPSARWAGGRYRLAVRVGTQIAWLQEVTVEGRAGAPRPTPCRVEPRNGVPSLVLDGKPNAAMVYMTYRPLGRHFRQFGEAGVHLHSFSSTPTEAGYGLAPACWLAPGKYDYSGIDLRAAQVLEADPAAYFFPRLYLFSPAWWDERHPDDLVTYDPGDGKPLPFYHAPGKRAPSWASPAWRRDTAQALRRYIRHVQSSPYADRVIGYHLASGTTEEWMQWGSNENQWVDYSPVNLAAFRRWLRDKYRTAAALQAAWADPQVTFERAAIPTQAQRAAGELGILRDPAVAMPCIDYVRYNAWLVADTIAYLARVVKQETGGQALVGAFYGYVLQLAGEQREQNAGHLALSQVLACPDVDFLTSPTSYMFRQLGTGYSHFMSLVDSVKLHGKMWFDENDIRTWLTREGNPGEAGKTATYQETLLHQRRELANVLCSGAGMWWFDMSGGWYDDPRLLADISRLKRVADECATLDRSPVAEVAVVVDDASLAYLQPGNRLTHHLLVRQLPELGRMGAPFAYVHLADLDRAPEYRMYVFPNCLAPGERERRLIRERVARGGHVVVWLWAPGLIRGERLDPQGMEELTGIRLALRGQATAPRVAIAADQAAWAGEAAGTSYGLEAPFAPTIFAQDPGARVLGTLGTGEAGLVVKECPGWTSVYSSAPELPHGLLRALAARAGVHLYAPGGDVVYANHSLLALSVDQGGDRTLRLPRPADVWDLYEGRELGRQVTTFTVHLADQDTRLFRIK